MGETAVWPAGRVKRMSMSAGRFFKPRWGSVRLRPKLVSIWLNCDLRLVFDSDVVRATQPLRKLSPFSISPIGGVSIIRLTVRRGVRWRRWCKM